MKKQGISLPECDQNKPSQMDQFIKRHGKTLWVCDFFSVKTVTARGLQEMYVLVFLCLKTREIITSPSTKHPNSAWVVEQTKDFIAQTEETENKPAILIHDRDTKFTKEFVATLTENDIKANALPKASPNLNGRCERVILTLKQECLSKFILFGKKRLDYLLTEFPQYYNQKRSQQNHV